MLRFHRWTVLVTAILSLSCSTAAVGEGAASAGAYLLVDADTGVVLASENATHPWYPASVTKVMTAYMVFQAIERGWIAPADKVAISAQAAAQPPSRLGLRTGQKVRIDALVEAMILRSANDAAVALAEAVSGSEEHFAISMTRRARELGMSQTFFRNASGLPHIGQVTSARDLVILARALIEDFPDRIRTLGNQHQLLRKTGFTCGSGYNLLQVTTQNRRRLIAVVLGARTSGERGARVAEMLREGFATPTDNASGTLLLSALRGQARQPTPYVLADGRCPVAPSRGTEAMAEGPLPGWGLVLGTFPDRAQAQAAIKDNRDALGDLISRGRDAILAKRREVPPSYSALLVGLQETEAEDACNHLRALEIYCLAVPPKLLNNPRALWR